MSYWNDERVEKLKKFWAEGLSAGQIALRLGGCSRSAVIGKVHRLGLSGRPNTLRGNASRRHAAKREKKPSPPVPGNVPQRAPVVPAIPKEPYTPPPPRSFDPAKLVTFADLEPGQCKWPVGDIRSEAGLKFCGEPQVIGQPYCPACCQVAYVLKDPNKAPERVVRWNFSGRGRVGKGKSTPAVSEALSETEDA